MTGTSSAVRRRRGVPVLVATALLLAGCTAPSGSPHEPASGVVAGDLVVFAAASLTDAFDDLVAGFVGVHPDVEVVRNHGGSQTLAGQLAEGAPADVFASADPRQMDDVQAAVGLAGDAVVLATNRLQIAVEPGNPLGITGLADLADPGLVLVLPAEVSAAGAYVRDVLDGAGLEVIPASLERDVRAARAKVALGEADAAIVFATDVAATDAVEGVDIPREQNVEAAYPIAVLADAPNPTAAAAFVAFTLSDAGQAILATHGFAPP